MPKIDNTTAEYYLEQKREDVFEEIIYNSDKTNLIHLRRLGWNGIPNRFRAPSWQLLLHYLPVVKSKRKLFIRRKRNEYHRHITKHYFEFDFCMTDRPLPTRTKEKLRNEHKTQTRHLDSSLSLIPQRNQEKNVPSESNECIEKTICQDSLPLFNQRDDKKSQKMVAKREDLLLLQIRSDINSMVDIPITSEQQPKRKLKKGSTSAGGAKGQSDFKTATSTTTNRSFANPRIKSSLERILYLWSVRWKKGRSATTYIRYVPGMTDIVYPIFLAFLQGYVWETHSSTSKEEEDGIGWKYGMHVKTNGILRDMLKKLEDDPHFDVKGFFHDTAMQSFGAESEVLGNEDRDSKITRCQQLCSGQGLDHFSDEIFEEIEADTYWCLDNLMTAIQDYRYDTAFSSSPTTNNIPSNAKGLQNMIVLMDEIVHRADPVLHAHLKSNGVEFLWFAFRWMNSLLVRDLNERCILRLWDTYLCEEVDAEKNGPNYYSTFGFNSERVKNRLHLSGFHSFQVYVCAALLHYVRESILKKAKFVDILQELQNLSLNSWDVQDISKLLSQAFTWKETFSGSERQLLLQSTTQYGSDTFSKWIEKCHWPPRKSGST